MKKITINSKQAELLLGVIGYSNVSATSTEMLELILKLRKATVDVADGYKMYLHCEANKPVAAIKALRTAFYECLGVHLGLKQAKDMYDCMDPCRNGGKFKVDVPCVITKPMADIAKDINDGCHIKDGSRIRYDLGAYVEIV